MSDVKIPMVYDQSEDQLVPVTQEWCDLYQSSVNKLAKRNEIIKMVCNLHPIKDTDKLNAIQSIVQSS